MSDQPRGSSAWRATWQAFPVKTAHTPLNALLLAVPAAFVVHYAFGGPPLVTFLVAALGIIPLAGVLGEATEDLAEHLGPQLGGLLNATMGNATELIIGFFALRSGEREIVKASLSGSILGNILLVLGMAVLVGGIGREKQTFSKQTASVNATMLFIAVVALVMPAVFDLAVYGRLSERGATVQHLSLWTSVILIVIYGLSLVFTFVTHRAVPAREATQVPVRSTRSATTALVLATVLIAFLSEMLVGELQAAKQAFGISDVFMGVVVIATIGNAAEHATAVLMAMRNQMELALTVAVGSSVQIALFVAPVLVFASFATGEPMTLVFSPLEITGIALAVLIVTMISADGETTWLEGAQLIAVYLLLAVALYFVP